MRKTTAAADLETVEPLIQVVRGQRIILDADLARIYGVPTKRLNEQVKRNPIRFPEDFMFQLTRDETGGLRSHFATSKAGRGGRRYLPFAFTEHGAIMAANILNSPQGMHILDPPPQPEPKRRQIGFHAARSEPEETGEQCTSRSLPFCVFGVFRGQLPDSVKALRSDARTRTCTSTSRAGLSSFGA